VRAIHKLLAAALLAGAGLAPCFAQAPPAADAQANVRPDVLVSAVTVEVLGILKRDAAAGQATDIAHLVAVKILPLFDFRRMTRLAVGRNWRIASPAQQDALVDQFTQLLVRTYSSALSSYRDQDIHYWPLRAAAGDTEVLVRSSVKQAGAQALTIDYEMENTVAGWKVYDVQVAGISLVLTHRETFAATVRDDGIDGLINALGSKNARAASPLK
jgi:phospholipid transport system substrate-binding protein